MSGYLRRPHTLKQTNEWLIAEAPPCSGSRRRRQGRSEDYPRPVLFHSVAGGSVACFLYAPTCTAEVRELTGTGAEAQTDSALGRQARRVSAGSVELTCAAILVGRARCHVSVCD